MNSGLAKTKGNQVRWTRVSMSKVHQKGNFPERLASNDA